MRGISGLGRGRGRHLGHWTGVCIFIQMYSAIGAFNPEKRRQDRKVSVGRVRVRVRDRIERYLLVGLGLGLGLGFEGG